MTTTFSSFPITTTMNNNNNGGNECKHLHPFKPLLEVEDINNNNNNNWYFPLHDHHENHLTFSPSQSQLLFQPKPTNPDSTSDYNFNMETGFLPINTGTQCLPEFDNMGVANLDPCATTQLANGYGSPGFLGLRPLENLVSAGEQPYFFETGAGLRKYSSETNTSGGGNLGVLNDVEDRSVNGSVMHYDPDDFAESRFQEYGFEIGDGGTSNASNTVGSSHRLGGHRRGNKKGLPAKNLMAERRRRQKVNDRLFLLRSVVPRISKMDRASILVDAIEYLKELLQKVNVLNLELGSNPSSSSVAPAAATSFHPLTLTGQATRVEVRQQDGGMVNIHMFCDPRPGLLLSVMRTLDSLGLDVQQAVVSCFNGFALDVFRAKQCNEAEDMQADEIKVMLLDRLDRMV